ncbi:MAG: hypothetical protein JWN53_15 [Gemmatimonadetes bacterium]|nr:hypothetical protein [Gemmatimonadota bacterium]
MTLAVASGAARSSHLRRRTARRSCANGWVLTDAGEPRLHDHDRLIGIVQREDVGVSRTDLDGFPAIVATGDYARDDFRAALEATLADLANVPARGLLLDLSQTVSVAARSAAQIEATAIVLGAHRDQFGGRLAIVATDEVTLALVRSPSAVSGIAGLAVQMFADRAAALGWLMA